MAAAVPTVVPALSPTGAADRPRPHVTKTIKNSNNKFNYTKSPWDPGVNWQILAALLPCCLLPCCLVGWLAACLLRGLEV